MGICLPTGDWKSKLQLFSRDDAARQRVERLLLRPGNLEFRILANPRDNTIERAMKDPKKSELFDSTGKRLAWWAPVKAGNSRQFTGSRIARRTVEKDEEEITQVLVLDDPYNIANKHLAAAKAGVDSSGDPCVEFSMRPDGAKRLAKLAGKHDFRLGIILDGQLQSAPSIRSVVSDHGQITGVFTKQNVADLADILNAGPLPMRLRLANP